MQSVMVLLFALAVSADGFIVGVAYGLRRIKIPLRSLLVICVASASAVTLAMLVGRGITSFLKPQTASRIGAVMIIVIGLVFLLQFCRQKLRDGQADEEEPLLSLKIKPLGIIIQILREPASADFDQSGEIGLREAFFLGLALAMDAFGAGIGIAMAGYNILLTAACVGVLKFILVSSGLKLGAIVTSARWQYGSSLATGMILIIIGLSELI